MDKNERAELIIGSAIVVVLILAFWHGKQTITQQSQIPQLPGLNAPVITVPGLTVPTETPFPVPKNPATILPPVPGLTPATNTTPSSVATTPTQGSCLCGCDSATLTKLYYDANATIAGYQSMVQGLLNNYISAVNKALTSPAGQSTLNSPTIPHGVGVTTPGEFLSGNL